MTDLGAEQSTPAVPASPEEGQAAAPFQPCPRSAALWSLLLPGAGHHYNRQLERALLFWAGLAALDGVGFGLGFLALLAGWIPPTWVRPPLADLVRANGGAVAVGWALALIGFWILAAWDARRSAERITRGELEIRYSLRRQWVHFLGSQVLGLIPLVGFLFPPSVVAEALDAARDRRLPDHRTLAREAKRGVTEGLLAQMGLLTVAVLTALWWCWWLARALGAPV